MSTEAVHAKAKAVREHRDAFEDSVRSGDVPYEGVFAAGAADPVLAGSKLLGLIESMPEFGKVQSRRAFEIVGLEETVRVGAVDSEQQSVLLEALGTTGLDST